PSRSTSRALLGPLSVVDQSTLYTSTLSLHDALPIFGVVGERPQSRFEQGWHLPAGANQPPPAAGERNGASPPRPCWPETAQRQPDRKSTRLNSSHVKISYAVFCLKKKNTYHEAMLA